MASPTDLTFYYDPRCPWAWVTSRWVEEIERQGLVRVSWKLMSLARLHEWDDDYDPLAFEKVRVMGRGGAAAAMAKGEQILGDYYSVIGRRIHIEQQNRDEQLVRDVFDELGIEQSAFDLSHSQDYDAYVAKTHDEAVEAAGEDLGTPVIIYNGKSFFGPVIKAAPKGAEAKKLWDAMVLLSEVDGVYEIKRSRPEGPIV
jgi:2-hydroxychromene-2-carboxylate isomerase